MLRTELLHPELLSILGRIGHSSKILIADSNYPYATRKNALADIVFLNFTPGVLSATDILKVLLKTIPVEKAEVMAPMREGPYAMSQDPAIFSDFRKILDAAGYQTLAIHQIERQAFYNTAEAKDTALIIASGEKRIYGNILLTLGVVVPAS